MDHIARTVLVLAALLGVLVVFHEFGHYTVARLVGMKVYEFAFGFGPIIARLFKRGDTQFNIRAVPLGGFVRIAQMEPGEEDVPGGFNSAPVWQRAVVVLAGPFMSLVLGYLVFLMIGFVWGFPSGKVSARLSAVGENTSAARAGLKPGDTILAIDGRRIKDGSDLKAMVGSSPGKELVLKVRRDSRLLTVEATPKLGKSPGQKKQQGLLGVELEPLMEHTGVVESVKRGTRQTFRVIAEILGTLFSKRIASEVGGILMIGHITGEMVKAGAYWVFIELAVLSVMLGVVNLIPWPVLDGGHMLYLFVEKIRGKKLEPERWYAIQTIGLTVLMVLVVFLFYLDISRLATGNVPR